MGDALLVIQAYSPLLQLIFQRLEEESLLSFKKKAVVADFLYK